MRRWNDFDRWESSKGGGERLHAAALHAFQCPHPLRRRQGKDGALRGLFDGHVDGDGPARVPTSLGCGVEIPFLGKGEQGPLLFPPTRHSQKDTSGDTGTSSTFGILE